MAKAKILVQLDSDAQASVFDSVVAIDAGVDHLLRHANVSPEAVRDLVYGAMFTRGPDDLKNTAVFVGGADVAAGEKLLRHVTECFFGPMRVSVMLDSNGANTTAAAAVRAAAKHVKLSKTTALVLAATGPVGQRVARLLAREGATVRAASRSKDRAQAVSDETAEKVAGARISAHETTSDEGREAALAGAQVIIAAGAPAVRLLSADARATCSTLEVAIDLSAVPPAGLEGIDPTDAAAERDGIVCYGAIGVGRTKMKIHKAAIAQLFQANDRVLDAEEIYRIACDLG